jgi:hypothetical protein
VLDSGINLSLNVFARGAKQHIYGWKGFLRKSKEVLTEDENDEEDDEVACMDLHPTHHGSHVASILLEQAPWANLYVARVCDEDERPDPEAVASVSLFYTAMFRPLRNHLYCNDDGGRNTPTDLNQPTIGNQLRRTNMARAYHLHVLRI